MRILGLGCILAACVLGSCAQKKTVEIPLVYHASFPKDVEVNMTKSPLSPETKGSWEMFVLGDRMLVSTSEMDNPDDKYAMFRFPDGVCVFL